MKNNQQSELLQTPKETMTFKTILLIDDDPAINYYHKYILEKQSITEDIWVANEVEVAVELIEKMNQKSIEELKPSIVFLDVNMPKYTGFEFISKHQKTFLELKNKGVTIFILTTSDNPNDIAASENVPIVTQFFQKPLSKEKLTEIKNLIED